LNFGAGSAASRASSSSLVVKRRRGIQRCVGGRRRSRERERERERERGEEGREMGLSCGPAAMLQPRQQNYLAKPLDGQK
jgi:hypothetical protein